MVDGHFSYQVLAIAMITGFLPSLLSLIGSRSSVVS